MAAKKTEGVRIGPISLIVLISVLLLAVLAMLCVTTANAARAMSRRQATAATDTYLLESCGQTMLAKIDEVAHAGGTDGASAASAVASQLSTIKQDAVDAEGKQGKKLAIDASTSGNSVAFTITSKDGRTLSARVTVSDNLAYTIDQWKITTAQTDESEASLWTGSDATETE